MTTIANQTISTLNNETIIEQQDTWSRVENINNYSFKNRQILKIFYQQKPNYSFKNRQILKIFYHGKPLINEYLVSYEKHNKNKIVFEIDNDGDEYVVYKLEDIVVLDENQPRKLFANQIISLWVEDKYKQVNYNNLIPRKLTYFEPNLATYSLKVGQMVSLIYHTNPTKLITNLKVVSSSNYELCVMEGNFPRKFNWEKVISMTIEHIFHTKLPELRNYSNTNYTPDNLSNGAEAETSGGCMEE
jgi:hypothetical protein